MTSEVSTPVAHELVEQMMSEGEEVEQTMRTRSTPCAYSSSDGPSSTSGNTRDRLRQLILCHPKYPKLVSLFYICKKFSAERTAAEALEAEEDAHLASVKEMRRHHTIPPELQVTMDRFMADKLRRLESIKLQLEASFQSVSRAAESLDNKISKLVLTKSWDHRIQDIPQNSPVVTKGASCSKSPSTGSGYLVQVQVGGYGASAPAGMDGLDINPEEIKRRYDLRFPLAILISFALSNSFLAYISLPFSLRRIPSSAASESMKKALLKRKKKGKLPDQATEHLKTWFEKNLVHPYPSDEKKSELMQITGLDSKQINNWFINQRKRHWASNGPGSQQGSKKEQRPSKVARGM